MVKYVYDAWGNHKIYDGDGGEVITTTHIGVLNPFRYRGYYFDAETELYFLQSRYYDPEIGRFITIDDHSYLDPDTVNGINLYAYCGNNPVMNVDPTGHFFLAALLLGAVVGAVVGGTVGGVAAYNSAESSGAEGIDLFVETIKGIGKGAVVGLVAGGWLEPLWAQL